MVIDNHRLGPSISTEPDILALCYVAGLKLVRGGREHGESSEGASCSEAGAVTLGARPRRPAA